MDSRWEASGRGWSVPTVPSRTSGLGTTEAKHSRMCPDCPELSRVFGSGVSLSDSQLRMALCTKGLAYCKFIKHQLDGRGSQRSSQ